MDASAVLSSWGTSLRTAERLNTKVCERPDLSEKKDAPQQNTLRSV